MTWLLSIAFNLLSERSALVSNGDLVGEEPGVGYRYGVAATAWSSVEVTVWSWARSKPHCCGSRMFGRLWSLPSPDSESGVRIVAFVSCQHAVTLTKIALKSYSARALPPYMIPDIFEVVAGLPRTSTDKTDDQRFKSLIDRSSN